VPSVNCNGDTNKLSKGLTEPMRTSWTRSPHSTYNVNADLWDEDDLLKRLCQTLDFAEQAIRQLAESAYTDDDATQNVAIRPEKVITETALLLLAASNVSTYTAIGPRILRVASLLVPHARSQRMLRAICLEPAAAFDSATAHICLKRLGFYDADVDAMLDLSVAGQAHEGREREPHGMLRQEWLKQSWLYPEGLPRLRISTWLTNSALNRTVDLLHGTREDFSCFMQALKCLRDFSLHPRPLPRSRGELIAEAEGMLGRALDEQDYQLAAEVLLAWPLTGEEWTPAASFAFRVLCRVQCETGFVALSSTAPAQPYSHPATYQTTYAMGMLCAAALAPGRRPPIAIPKVAVRTGAFDAVFECFDPDDRKAHWQTELDELNAAERESLTEFLLSIALHREFGKRDFAAMQRLLRVGNALNLTSSPVATQAAELMSRVTQFADILSYTVAAPDYSEAEEEYA
jgi:hypothetical protein